VYGKEGGGETGKTAMIRGGRERKTTTWPANGVGWWESSGRVAGKIRK